MTKKLWMFAFFCVVFLAGCDKTPPHEEEQMDTYTITWRNHDGTVLKVENGVAKDTNPSYQGVTPTREGDEVCDYRFVGWSPELSPVDRHITYFAEFVEIFTITWVNYDGTVLKVEEDVAYGDIPTYHGNAPTKEEDDQCTYVFREWYPIEAEVTKKQTYTALFDSHGSGNNLTYRKYYDGLLLIMGLNNKAITDLIIPNYIDGVKVDGINNSAFSYEESLTSIVIHDSLTEIHNYAFANCINLQSVFIPSSVRTIGEGVFTRCSSLEEVELSEGVVEIGAQAFSFCGNLTHIRIPNSVESVNSDVFWNCEKLVFNEYDQAYYLGNESNPYLVLIEAMSREIEHCEIHGDTRVIAGGAFYQCVNLTGVIIPENVVSIGWMAFYQCSSLTEIHIPDSVKLIAAYSFANCSNLETVTLGDQVRTIGFRTFKDCISLYSIIFSENMVSINSNAFEGCSNIQYNEYDNAIYLGNNSNPYIALIKAVNNRITDLLIHEDTRIIADSALAGCRFASIELPNNLVSIGSSSFQFTPLTSIVIPDSVQFIGVSAFSHCTQLQHVFMGSGVTTISAYAFNDCKNLLYNEYDNAYYLGNESNPYIALIKGITSATSIQVHQQTRLIAANAFYPHSKLESIYIPMSVLYINKHAFYQCYNLVIYAEVVSKPVGWDSHYNPVGCEVYWSYQG